MLLQHDPHSPGGNRLFMRFGIGQDEPCTLEQVGQSLSVTRERIRQIEAKALKKLKTPEIRQMFAAIQ